MQTTLLGLAIAFIIALLAALIGPLFVDWNQYRPKFEAEATRIIGMPVRVAGELDARLLPTPTLRLRSVTVGGSNDLGKLGADKLDVEFSLGALMRGEWRATELTINGMAADLGLDGKGRVDLPSARGSFNLASLAIERLNLTGRIALHDAASRSTLELKDIVFNGDVRSLAGAVRGDGSFTASGLRYPFRVSSGPSADGTATRIHLNIDPGERPIVADLEGALTFGERVPRFDGALTLAAPPAKAASKGNAAVTTPPPWKVTAKLKADPAAAKFDQIEASIGTEDTALKVSGAGDLKFGASPLLSVVLSARQLDADKLIGKDDNADPPRILPALRTVLAAIPEAPIPARIEFNAEQIMLGGRPLQNIAAELHTDGKTNGKTEGRIWTFQRLDLRAPGATQVSLNGAASQSDSFSGRLSIESFDPDVLVAWLQGRSEVSRRAAKPLRLSGDVMVASNHLSIEKLKAEIEGGSVGGRVSFAQTAADGGSKMEAELKADRLDLDAAASLVRSMAGPQPDWPDEAKLSLDVDHAILTGQELQPFFAKLEYDPKRISLDQLKIGQAGGETVEGSGNLDRDKLQGRLVLNSTAASLKQIASFAGMLAPSLAARLAAIDSSSGPANANLVLDLSKNEKGQDDRRTARAQLVLATPLVKGRLQAQAAPSLSDLRGLDLDALARSEFNLDARLSSERGSALLALLGLGHAVAAGEGPAQFEGKVSGAWSRPLQLNAKLSGSALDADAQGSAELSTPEPKANVNLRVRKANLAPLFGLGSSAQNVNLSSRVTLAGNKLTFNDLDGTASGSRLRGHLAISLDEENSVDGEVGLDTLHLAPALAIAAGAAGQDASEPIKSRFLNGWRGRVAFDALRGVLPGGAELRPFRGTIRNDGRSLALDALKGGFGGGEMTAGLDVRDSTNGLSLNSHVQLTNVDAAVLHYGNLALSKGRVSAQIALSSQGRSVAALTGALAGNGTVTLESAEVAGLDPRAFEIAIRASDRGEVADDARLRQLVEPALLAGPLVIGSAQIPFTIRDGRLRVSATTLEARNARAIVSGGYDIPAGQADLRASFSPIMTGLSGSPPEVQLFVAGSPDKLSRTVDLTSLSSWLAVRTIDRETKRLDAIDRGEAPPAAAAVPTLVSPDPAPEPAATGAKTPASGPRAVQPKARPKPQSKSKTAPNPPVASQQVVPLPPPVEIKPAPGSTRAKPKPRPPLVLTPQANQ